MTGGEGGADGAAPGYDLGAWRARIPLLRRAIPLNNCSQAPQTTATRAAAEAYLDSWDRTGMDWEAWLGEVDAARAEFAGLIGARPEDVAVTTSVSAATASFASALDWSGGRDGVAVTEAEFPTVGHVWLAQRRHGARVARVPLGDDGVIEPDAYDDAVDDRTLVVSACHAHYRNGFVQDLREVAERVHARGALLFVDAYQSLGTVPVDVEHAGVDALTSGCLKYLLGVPGLAFLYVRPGLAERLRPTVTGWLGQDEEAMFDARRLSPRPAAARFDTGTPPVANAYICRAGMRIIREVGPERIRAWTRLLSGRLVEGGEARGLDPLGPRDPDRRTPLTAFDCGDTAPERVEAELRRRGVIASARGRAIRLAPHFYNTVDEIDAALDALAEVLG
ncbi:MAG: aminotransferase class V-fold PLP-dependent enzyme [Gemmatimonadota bacterium]